MYSLLVDAPSGAQELTQVEQSGAYFDPSRVLWDERVNGPLPAITLGGMVKQGSTLVFSQIRKDAHDAALRVVPSSVTRRQGMAVLIKYGLDAQIDAALNAQMTAATNSGNAQAILSAKFAVNDWKESQLFLRGWPLIAQMQQVFSWTSSYVDSLFIEAATL